MFVAVYLKERRRSRTPYQDLKTITGQTVARVAGKTPPEIITLEEHYHVRAIGYERGVVVETTQYAAVPGDKQWYKTGLWTEVFRA